MGHLPMLLTHLTTPFEAYHVHHTQFKDIQTFSALILFCPLIAHSGQDSIRVDN